MNHSDLIQMYDFTGRTVMITGGTGILCGAMAEMLAGAGANIAVLARNPEKGAALLARLNSVGGKGCHRIIPGDVLDKESLVRAAEQIRAEYGHLDCLVNGAGGNSPQATTRPDQKFFDLPEEALRYVFDLNLLGTIMPSQVFGRQMAERGTGVMLNVSSMAAIRPMTRVVGYAAAKAAIDNFTRWLAVHLAQEYSPQLRVNAVAPGFFITEQNRSLLTNIDDASYTARGQAVISHTPMNRFGHPDDLLGAVMWLLSPASSFVTGVVVPVDGGFSAFAGV